MNRITSRIIKMSLINITVAIGIGIILDTLFCLMQLKAIVDPEECDETNFQLDASNCQYRMILLDVYGYSFIGLFVSLPFLITYLITMVYSLLIL